MTTSPADKAAAAAAVEQTLLASRTLCEAPEAAIQRAIGIWTLQPAAGAADGRLQRLLAALRYDSAAGAPVPAGVRGGAPRARQVLFSAGGRDVDLRITPQGDGVPRRYEMFGQLLGPDARGTVHLNCPGYQESRDWNDLAEFRFENVPAAVCHLTLRSDAWEIELPPIDLATQP